MGQPDPVELPVNTVLPELSTALQSHGSAVLAAPPGSGKTTLVPLKLLAEPWLRGGRILLLEPRRIAARAAARFMAQQLGERVGERVGYCVRQEQRISSATRIEVLTEGILTRRLQDDPELAGVGLVIFDEVHERNLHTDLALALCLDVRHGLRPDLRILVMSATLDTRAWSRLLAGAPCVAAHGRSHPVEVRYLEREPQAQRRLDNLVRVVQRALQEHAGDVLVFLPGQREIRTALRRLEESLPAAGPLLCPLFGDLSLEAQDRAIRPDGQGRRRVVLATSIAETSLTIEGIKVVVDYGWSRGPRFDPNRGLSRLETFRASQASVEQRAGRAGRLAPGVCYRLWPEAMQARLRRDEDAEILHADLAPLALELALWGVTDPGALHWMQAPPRGAYGQAVELLQQLGALDSARRITSHGAAMARLGTHPRLAHMLLKATSGGREMLSLACDLAALLSERDLLRADREQRRGVDIESRLQVLRRWRAGHRRGLTATAEDCRRVDAIAGRWMRLLTAPDAVRGTGSAPTPGALLACAYPDRVGRLRGASDGAYLLSSGRATRLPEGDVLGGAQFLVMAQLDGAGREGRVFLAAELSEAELRETLAERIDTREHVAWDARSRSVVALREERLGALVLRSEPLAKAPPEAIQAALLEGIRGLGAAVLPWSVGATELCDRVLCLRQWEPDADWPDLSEAALLQDLESWLGPWLPGMRRAEDLRALDLLSALRQRLGWRLQQRLEREAPTHLQVPSGSRRRLRYRPGEPPVLCVRLQEMFGLADTPRVAGGRIPVMLHLLSPAQRPIQITQDLRSFWDRTYLEVRKELQGRYPKHHWPLDPWNAAPSARVRGRRG